MSTCSFQACYFTAVYLNASLQPEKYALSMCVSLLHDHFVIYHKNNINTFIKSRAAPAQWGRATSPEWPYQYNVTLRFCWRHSPRRWIRAHKSRNCWDIFLLNCSFSQRQAMDSPTPAKTLPLFYSEPYIQVSVYSHHETDRWQLHRHGTREGPRTAWKAIWQQERAGMSDCEGFGMGPKLQSCVGKRPQSRKQECAVEGEVGELQEAPELTEDRHTLRVGVVSLWMWGWNVYWLQCNMSRDGCVHLLYTAQYK